MGDVKVGIWDGKARSETGMIHKYLDNMYIYVYRLYPTNTIVHIDDPNCISEMLDLYPKYSPGLIDEYTIGT